MQLEIFSDVICPWCFIGKRRLDQTLTEPLREVADRFQISWRAYQLYPQLPEAGMDREEFMRMRFGDRAAVKDVYSRIESEGDSAGITFNFRGVKRMPNTRSAHRLIRLGAEHGVQSAIVEYLFRQHFIEGNDIGDLDTLINAAKNCGLDADASKNYLQSDRGLDELLADFQFALDAGISGVPCYVVDRSFAIPGAQPVEVLARYLGKALLKNA